MPIACRHCAGSGSLRGFVRAQCALSGATSSGSVGRACRDHRRPCRFPGDIARVRPRNVRVPAQRRAPRSRLAQPTGSVGRACRDRRTPLPSRLAQRRPPRWPAWPSPHHGSRPAYATRPQSNRPGRTVQHVARQRRNLDAISHRLGGHGRLSGLPRRGAKGPVIDKVCAMRVPSFVRDLSC